MIQILISIFLFAPSQVLCFDQNEINECFIQRYENNDNPESFSVADYDKRRTRVRFRGLNEEGRIR